MARRVAAVAQSPRALAAPVSLALILCSCSQTPTDRAPQRATDRPPDARETSFIAAPIEADAASLRKAVEAAIPKTLWTINRREPRCIPPQKLRLLGASIKINPAIACTIVGDVERGAISLHGERQSIIINLPVDARISARDVGGVLKGETATGSAMVRARVTFDLSPDWTPAARVSLDYDWTKEPGVDFLGQRIRFTDEADRKLRPIVARLERDLPQELKKLDLRAKADTLWRTAFTTLELNQRNPPAWMRVSPSRILYGGYRLDGSALRLDVGLEAKTETIIGARPAALKATPLPPLERTPVRDRLAFNLPVTADYAVLIPVIQRALDKRSRRPFDLPGADPVMARFKVTDCYGAVGGRIAVGVTVTARPAGERSDTHGRIWLAARPVNAPNSATISFADPVITGDTDGVEGDLALAIGQSSGFSNLVAAALGQNFDKDIAELKGKIARAIGSRREGDFVIQASADRYEIGTIHAYGTALHLPVRATGKARILYRPL